MEVQSSYKMDSTNNLGKTRRKRFLEKAKKHKKEIAIGAAIVISAMVAIIVFKNKSIFKPELKSLGVEEILSNNVIVQNSAVPVVTESIEISVPSCLSNGRVIDVREHIRNLPKGWHPSTSKVELAAKYGYSLEEHQTWVNAHTKVA